jgi:regulator of sirC expression with transglutaminase-like and TPR domain
VARGRCRLREPPAAAGGPELTVRNWHRKALQEEVQRRDEDLDLARAALLIACEEHPDLEVSSYLRKLDAMAGRIESMLKPDPDCFEIIGTINHYLFNELQFAGNTQDYYNADNSYLNYVLDHGVGIPVTLSIVYLELAWRIGFDIDGVGLPGHFIVKHDSPTEGEIYIDPFTHGSILSAEECEERMRRATGERTPFQQHYLGTVTKRQILQRLLHNLKTIHLRRQDYKRALSVIQLALVLAPWNLDEVRDRGLVLYQLRDYKRALVDLENYLHYNPDASDAPRINLALEFLRAMRESR